MCVSDWGDMNVRTKVRTIFPSRASPGKRRLSSRIDLAVENVCDSVARFLSWDTSPDNGRYVLMIDPRIDDHGANGMHYDNSIWALSGDGLNDSIGIMPQPKVQVSENRVLTAMSTCVRLFRSPSLSSTTMYPSPETEFAKTRHAPSTPGCPTRRARAVI